MVTIGAKSHRIGEASIVCRPWWPRYRAADDLRVPIYWSARTALGAQRNQPVRRQPPEGRQRTARLRADHPPLRLGGDRARLLPARPERAVYAAAGWTRMRLIPVPAARPARLPAVDRAVRRARLRDRPGSRRRGRGHGALCAVGDAWPWWSMIVRPAMSGPRGATPRPSQDFSSTPGDGFSWTSVGAVAGPRAPARRARERLEEASHAPPNDFGPADGRVRLARPLSLCAHPHRRRKPRRGRVQRVDAREQPRPGPPSRARRR